MHGGAHVQVRVSARREGGRVALRVSDNGPGISPANQAKVFQPFFNTARQAGGTGLGLAIVQALVKGCGGELALASDAGGTNLTVMLPTSDA